MFSGMIQLASSDAHSSGDTQENPLGTLAMTPDGYLYRYALAGGVTLDPGKLCVPAAIVANHENMSVASAVAVGATKVTVTLGATAATANQYKDGKLVMNDAAGEGIAYRISGHPAAATTANLVVTLAEPVKVALTTSSQASLIANPWSAILVSVTDQADMAIGVPNVSITNAEYGWVQTRGVCAGLADETLAIGTALTIGSSVAGAFEVLDAAGEQNLGVSIQAGVDTEYRAVYLMID